MNNGYEKSNYQSNEGTSVEYTSAPDVSIYDSHGKEIFLKNTYTENMDLDKAKEALAAYTDDDFESDSWLIKKAQKGRNQTDYKAKIVFYGIESSEMLTQLKLWAVRMIIMRQSVSQIRGKVNHVRAFLKLIDHNMESFGDCNENDILNYYHYVFDINNKEQTKLEKWYSLQHFFEDIGCDYQSTIMKRYTVKKYSKGKKRHDEKYIPDEVADRLDYIFKTDNNIPVTYRAAYWTLRLFPNRVTEVASIPINALKQVSMDEYTLSIPTFKQSGPFAVPEIKIIFIKYENMGKYYIDLLKETENIARTLECDNFSVKYFFTCYDYRRFSNDKKYVLYKKRPRAMRAEQIANMIKSTCLYNKIIDENGEPYTVTTHQFRHNAISDRANSGTFRIIDIMSMTAHKSQAMLHEAYEHTNANKLAEKVHNIEKTGSADEEAPAVFRGRIIYNDSRYERILKRPFAKRIYHLGVCSDVRACDKDRFACVDCKYLKVNIDDLDYIINERNEWEKKLEMAKKQGMDYFADNCEINIERYNKLINRIITSTTNLSMEAPNEKEK